MGIMSKGSATELLEEIHFVPYRKIGHRMCPAKELLLEGVLTKLCKGTQ